MEAAAGNKNRGQAASLVWRHASFPDSSVLD
jgi:hypothetical protein